MPSQKKALAIFPGALGDFVCFLPTLETLQRQQTVDLLAREEYADLLPPWIMTRSLECYEVRRLFVPGAELDDNVVQFFGSYASVYSWMGYNRPEFVNHLRRLTQGTAWIFPFRPSISGVHQVNYFLSCLDELDSGELFPSIHLKEEAIAWCSSFIRARGLQHKAILALSPGSGAQEKNWPAENFALISQWWKEKTKGEVLVMLGPVEEERGGCEDLSPHSLAMRGLPLSRVAALLVQSSVYLGNDSGLTHLAAALGLETIALFGPSDVREWSPRGKKVAVITKNVECSPCVFPVMKACTERRCLTTLEPLEVIGKLGQVWERACLTRVGVEIKVTGKNHQKLAGEGIAAIGDENERSVKLP